MQSYLVDAEALLGLTAGLRTACERVEQADTGEAQRRRWRQTIAGIAAAAGDDLDRAAGQLRRFVAQLDRAGA